MGFLIVLMYVISMCYGPISLYKAARHRPFNLPFFISVFCLWINIVYVSLVVNFVGNTGENSRFRFMIDPLIVISVGIFLQDMFGKLSSHREASRQ